MADSQQIPLDQTPSDETLQALCENGAGQLVAFVVHCHHSDYDKMRFATFGISLALLVLGCANLLILLIKTGPRELMAKTKGQIHLLCATLLPIGMLLWALSLANPWALTADIGIIALGLISAWGSTMLFQVLLIQKYYFYIVCVAQTASVSLRPLVGKSRMRKTKIGLWVISAIAWLGSTMFTLALTPSIDPYTGKSSIAEVQDAKTYIVLTFCLVSMATTATLGVQTHKLFSMLHSHTTAIGNELHRDQSKLEHVYRVGKQTVWICVIVFGVETLGAVLAISSLIARVAEYKQVSWATLWSRTAIIFAITAIAYATLLYANRYYRDDAVKSPVRPIASPDLKHDMGNSHAQAKPDSKAGDKESAISISLS